MSIEQEVNKRLLHNKAATELNSIALDLDKLYVQRQAAEARMANLYADIHKLENAYQDIMEPRTEPEPEEIIKGTD